LPIFFVILFSKNKKRQKFKKIKKSIALQKERCYTLKHVVERISKIVKFRQISKKTKKHVDIVC
jgi:DNA polymerase I-like protein with 3'-5' exonuclease and polymerase domains